MAELGVSAAAGCGKPQIGISPIRGLAGRFIEASTGNTADLTSLLPMVTMTRSRVGWSDAPFVGDQNGYNSQTTSQRNLLMGAGAPSAAGCPDAGGDRMTSYLRFASGEGETADVLVEVDAAEDLPVASEQNAGLRQWARNQAGEAVAVAQSGFEQAVRRAVSLNVRAFLAAAEALEEPPAEMEITFGLKATGEVGNLAVGKVAGESNYQVKMVWRRPAEE